MTPAEFDRIGCYLHGPTYPYKLAPDLGVTARAVYYYRNGEKPIPESIAILARMLYEQKKAQS